MFHALKIDRKTCSARAQAFTIVELLVVISLIVIILAILFPAINSALKRGKKAKCLSNLRSWAFAITCYCSDHNGDFPEEGVEKGGLKPEKPEAWYNALPPYMGAPTLWEMIDDLGHPPRPGGGPDRFSLSFVQQG